MSVALTFLQGHPLLAVDADVFKLLAGQTEQHPGNLGSPAGVEVGNFVRHGNGEYAYLSKICMKN